MKLGSFCFFIALNSVASQVIGERLVQDDDANGLSVYLNDGLVQGWEEKVGDTVEYAKGDAVDGAIRNKRQSLDFIEAINNLGDTINNEINKLSGFFVQVLENVVEDLAESATDLAVKALKTVDDITSDFNSDVTKFITDTASKVNTITSVLNSAPLRFVNDAVSKVTVITNGLARGPADFASRTLNIMFKGAVRHLGLLGCLGRLGFWAA